MPVKAGAIAGLAKVMLMQGKATEIKAARASTLRALIKPRPQ
jgi:hypothetical protein